MDHLRLVHQYLREKASLREIRSTGYPFVTISREAGAGGHLLAHVLVTDMLRETDRSLFEGWHVFDREICELVADDPELRGSMEALVREEHGSALQSFLETLISGRSREDLRYRRTFQVVRILALLGKVVLVGRAGACVTRDLPQGVHIRLVAPEETRVRWMMKKLKRTAEEARREIRRLDEERRRMVRTFFHRDIADPLLYDVVWNSERADPHEISQAVLRMIRRRSDASPS